MMASGIQIYMPKIRLEVILQILMEFTYQKESLVFAATTVAVNRSEFEY